MSDKSETEYQRAVARVLGGAQRHVNRMRERCLYPGCVREAINSHAQPVAAQLQTIAENHYVYAAQNNHYQVAKALPAADPIALTRIANASSFLGFCREHDNALFAPLERQPLTHNNAEQANLLFLRAVAQEFSSKRRAAAWGRFVLENAGGILDQELKEYLTGLEEGKKVFLDRDGPYWLQQAWDRVLARNFGRLTTLWRLSPGSIGISSSCCMSPLMDAHTPWMIEHDEDVQPCVTVSIIPSVAQSHIVVSWLPEWDELCDWITFETTTKEGLQNFVNLAAFAESDDTCIRPSLWDGVPLDFKHEVFRAMMPNHERGPLKRVPHIVIL